MKTKVPRFAILFVLSVLLVPFFSTGCSTINKIPVVRDLVPDLTNPAELHDAAELIGVIVINKHPDQLDDLQDAILRAENALAGEVITRDMFNGWIDSLLERNISDPVIRVFVRQRFARAWDANHQLLDISGLVLKNSAHRELAEAFIAGLRKAADDFARAGATVRTADSPQANRPEPVEGLTSP